MPSEIQTLQFSSVPSDREYVLRAAGTTELSAPFVAGTANATLATLIAGLPAYDGAAVTVSGSLSTATDPSSGETRRSGTKTVEFEAEANLPQLEVLVAESQRWVVEDGTAAADYSYNGSPARAIAALTAAQLQTDLRDLAETDYDAAIVRGQIIEGGLAITEFMAAAGGLFNRGGEIGGVPSRQYSFSPARVPVRVRLHINYVEPGGHATMTVVGTNGGVEADNALGSVTLSSADNGKAVDINFLGNTASFDGFKLHWSSSGGFSGQGYGVDINTVRAYHYAQTYNGLFHNIYLPYSVGDIAQGVSTGTGSTHSTLTNGGGIAPDIAVATIYEEPATVTGYGPPSELIDECAIACEDDGSGGGGGGGGVGASEPPDTPDAPTTIKQTCTAIVVDAPVWPSGTSTMPLRRRKDGGNWTTVHTWTTPNTQFVDIVEEGAEYEYAARACNQWGCSDWSEAASVAAYSDSLTITILDPAADSTVSGVVTLRFQLADDGEPPDPDDLGLQVLIDGLPLSATPTIETPDPCVDDEVEIRNAIYAADIDTRWYPQGVSEITVGARGTDGCRATESVAVTLQNDLAHGVRFYDEHFLSNAPPGYRWTGATVGLENRALSPVVEQRWWVQWALATDTSPAWPLDGTDIAGWESEWSKMQRVTPQYGQRYEAQGSRIETGQMFGEVAPYKLDYPGQRVVWRQRWEPLEPAPGWYATGYDRTAKIRAITALGEDEEGELFLVLAKDVDGTSSGLLVFDGTALVEIASEPLTILDATARGDKIYALLNDDTVRVYDRDSGQIALDVRIPSEARPFRFLEAVGDAIVLLAVDSTLAQAQTAAYDLTFATPQQLWTLDAVASLTAIDNADLGIAAGTTLYSAATGRSAPVLSREFDHTITALHRAMVGLSNGEIWLHEAATGWALAASRPTAITALGAWRGAAGRERAVAATATPQLFEQPATDGAWVLGRTLEPPAAIVGATIDGVAALAQWIQATTESAVEGTPAPASTETIARDALLIGTYGANGAAHGLLGLMERSALSAADGAFQASTIFNPNLDPIATRTPLGTGA